MKCTRKDFETFLAERRSDTLRVCKRRHCRHENRKLLLGFQPKNEKKKLKLLLYLVNVISFTRPDPLQPAKYVLYIVIRSIRNFANCYQV
jgi:hypothetical protein